MLTAGLTGVITVAVADNIKSKFPDKAPTEEVPNKEKGYILQVNTCRDGLKYACKV